MCISQYYDFYIHKYFHLVVSQKLVAQIAGIADVQSKGFAMIENGIGIAQFNGNAVIARHHIIERLKLLAIATCCSK